MIKNNIKYEFIKYTSLNIIGMVGLSCYILADTFFIAQGVGIVGLTSLNIALPIYMLMHATGLMIGIGGATKYSIYNLKDVFTKSISYAFLISMFFVLIGAFFTKNISLLLGANAETLEHTKVYMQTILLASPLFLFNNVVICFVRNDNNPKLSMCAMTIGCLSNIILDYILIFPFKLGMFGAAFATTLSPTISLIILSLHFINKKNNLKIYKAYLLIKLKDLISITSTGVATFVTELSSGIVMVVFNIIILNISGNIGVAAYGIIANISLVIISIFTGISQGIQPLISRCYGENRNKDIKKILKYSVITSITISVIIYLFSIFFTDIIISFFNKDTNIVLSQIANTGIKIYFISYVFSGLNIVITTYLNSITKIKYAFIISLLRGFLVLIPFVIILSSIFKINGVWASVPLTELIILFISIHMLKQSN